MLNYVNYLSSSTSQCGQVIMVLLEVDANRQSWQHPQQGGGWCRRKRVRLRSSNCSQYIFFRSCLIHSMKWDYFSPSVFLSGLSRFVLGNYWRFMSRRKQKNKSRISTINNSKRINWINLNDYLGAVVKAFDPSKAVSVFFLFMFIFIQLF